MSGLSQQKLEELVAGGASVINDGSDRIEITLLRENYDEDDNLVSAEGIWGEPEVDSLYEGTDGADVIIAGQGDDVVKAGDGDDYIYGDALHITTTVVSGTRASGSIEWHGTGVDADNSDSPWSLHGEGHDLVFGEAGNDRIFGGAGMNILHGGPGEDELYSQGDYDVLIGGDGHDVFGVWTGSWLPKEVRIADFTAGEDTVAISDNFPAAQLHAVAARFDVEWD